MSLSFLAYIFYDAYLWIPSNDFWHLVLGAGSKVFDGWSFGSITLASFLAKSFPTREKSSMFAGNMWKPALA